MGRYLTFQHSGSQGSGFSTNTGGSGNIIQIGKYFCDAIPLHCTVNQIACKTRTALVGAFNEWTGWTDPLPLTVVVDGEESECVGTCKFQYNCGWYWTPRILGITPAVVEEGTLLTVSGRFHATPFEYERLRAPSMEIPLASVKIANRALEGQRPENEPFGQSGTRCALFNQNIEEPFGVGDVSWDCQSGQPGCVPNVNRFICEVNGPREAGRYNLSVALLGTGMGSLMNMGESHVQSNLYLDDHKGISFMLCHVAKVLQVSPSRSGMMGGARLTITGGGFSNDKSVVKVFVAGDPCLVDVATMGRLECVLAPRASATSSQNGNLFKQGALQPGARGLRRRIWYNRGTVSIDTLRSGFVVCGYETQTCKCTNGTVRYGAQGRYVLETIAVCYAML